MPHGPPRLTAPIADESGFTLIELLVVILIIGILAAIALPAFLDQRKKGQDSDAKSNARNLVSEVESCFANQQDYTLCDEATTAEIGTDTGIDFGTGGGQATVQSAVPRGFTIVAVSRASSDVAGTPTPHSFSIIRGDVAFGYTRRCGPTGGAGGCRSGGTW